MSWCSKKRRSFSLKPSDCFGGFSPQICINTRLPRFTQFLGPQPGASLFFLPPLLHCLIPVCFSVNYSCYVVFSFSFLLDCLWKSCDFLFLPVFVKGVVFGWGLWLDFFFFLEWLCWLDLDVSDDGGWLCTQAWGAKRKRRAMGEAAGDRVLSRLHSVRERIGDSLSAHPNELVAVFTRFVLI